MYARRRLWHLGSSLNIPMQRKIVTIKSNATDNKWKHLDWRTGDVEVRRSRRLVVSFFTTVANYEYGI